MNFDVQQLMSMFAQKKQQEQGQLQNAPQAPGGHMATPGFNGGQPLPRAGKPSMQTMWSDPQKRNMLLMGLGKGLLEASAPNNTGQANGVGVGLARGLGYAQENMSEAEEKAMRERQLAMQEENARASRDNAAANLELNRDKFGYSKTADQRDHDASMYKYANDADFRERGHQMNERHFNANMGMKQQQMDQSQYNADRNYGLQSQGLELDYQKMQAAQTEKANKPDPRVDKFNDAAAKFENISNSINLYKASVDKHGAEILGPESKEDLRNKRTQVLLQIKELEELGALQAADMEVIDGMLRDPTTFGSAFGQVVGGDPLGKGIENLQQYVGNKYKTFLKTRPDLAGQQQQRIGPQEDSFKLKGSDKLKDMKSTWGL